MSKIRTLRDLEKLQPIDLPRVGDTWTLIAVTTTGRQWRQPVRIISTHTTYIVARAIPPEGDTMPEEQMSLQTFSKATHHRVRHDGTVSQSEWIIKDPDTP